MFLANIIASALVIAGSLAAPHPIQSNDLTDRSVQIFPPKYWGLASNQEKRTADADIIAREYWAFAIKLRDDEITKRGTMDPQCEKAKEGVYCKYTKADVEAFGAISSAHLEEECVAVDNGVSCFYPNKTV